MDYTKLLSPMYYQGKQILLVEKEETDESVITCHGCVLESDNNCVRAISPPQGNNICCPKWTGKFYVFKYAQDELITEDE